MIRDLMVHLDGGDEDGTRLAHAEALSAHFGEARITGLYTNPLPEYAYVLGVQSGIADMGPVLDLEEQLRREGDRVAEKLEQRLARPGAAHEVRRIDDWPSRIPDLVASQARWADLFVATAPYRDASSTWNKLVESVLFESGRGLFLVPPRCPVRNELRSVLFAWKDSVEAARALREGLPFFVKASLVFLLAVDTDGEGELGQQAADIAAHLDRHGAKVEVRVVEGKNDQVGSIIQDQASRISADLTVMGAYGHSRVRELVLGGATRDLIQHSRIPLLLAH